MVNYYFGLSLLYFGLVLTIGPSPNAFDDLRPVTVTLTLTLTRQK